MNSYNILLSDDKFNRPNMFKELKNIIKPGMRVVVLPFSFDFDWLTKNTFDNIFNNVESEHYQQILRPFRDYGIDGESIYIVNRFRDNKAFIKYKIEKADIIYFTGGNPVNIRKLVTRYGLTKAIQNFKGIVMGLSAGAMIQCDNFLLYPDDDIGTTDFTIEKGISLVHDVDVLVHYIQGYKPHEDAIQENKKLRPNTEYFKLRDGTCLIFKKGILDLSVDID